MKIGMVRMTGIVAIAVVGIVIVVGCCKKSNSEPTKTAGVAERTGAAVDKAAQKTAAKVPSPPPWSRLASARAYCAASRGRPGAMQAQISERMKAPQLSRNTVPASPHNGGGRPARIWTLAVPYSLQCGVTYRHQ